MTPGDEVFWSAPIVVAALGTPAVLAALGRLPRWRESAQGWLDRTLGQEAPEPVFVPCTPTTASHVRILPDLTFDVTFETASVDRQLIDLLWGDRHWRPYDWQIDGDGWP